MNERVMLSAIALIALLFSQMAFAEKKLVMDSKKPVEIALALRFNDGYNSIVQSYVTGTEAAIELFWRKNPSIKVAVERYSHGEGLDDVARVAKQIAQDKPVAMIGGINSSEAFVFRDLVAAKEIVFVSPTATHPDVTLNSPFTFRTCSSIKDIAKKLAEFMVAAKGFSKVGVMRNHSNPNTDFAAKVFAEEVVRLTGSDASVMTVGYLNDRIDFAEAIKTFKDAGVTHVAMLTLQDELTKFVTQAHEQNFHPIYIGSDGWGTDRILLDKLMAIPSSIRNFFGFRNTFWDLSRPNLLGKSLIRYLAEKKLSPNWAHAAGFDSMWLVLSGLKAMGYRNDARTLKNELLKLKDLELVSLGKLKWGGDNTPIADIKVFKVELPSQKNSVKK